MTTGEDTQPIQPVGLPIHDEVLAERAGGGAVSELTPAQRKALADGFLFAIAAHKHEPVFVDDGRPRDLKWIVVGAVTLLAAAALVAKLAGWLG